MDIENIPEPEYNSDSEQPTPEQLFIRMAAKHLTSIQKQVWQLHNYDRLTQDEIGQRLGKARTTIETQIKQCEQRIARWCKEHMDAYNALKVALEDNEDLDRANGMQEYQDAKHQTPIRRSEYDNEI